MTTGITRAHFLRGGLAALAAAAPGLAFARPAGPSLLDLDFHPIHRFRPIDLLPQKFIQVQRDFRGPAQGPALEVVSGGLAPDLIEAAEGLRIRSVQSEPTLLRLDAGLAAPYGAAIVTFAAGEPATEKQALLAGLARDGANYVVAALERDPGSHGHLVSIDVCVAGQRTRVASVRSRVARASELAFVLNENYVTALLRREGEWTPVVQHRIDGVLDLRKPQDLQRYRFAVGSAGESAGATISEVRAGYFGQVGLRDLHTVSYADGRPYIRDGKLYLTATQAGLSFFQAAHWGVWTLDLARPDRMEPLSKIFFARDGLLLGDHAGHIVVDERTGGFHVAVSSWGDFAYKGVHVRYCRTSENILSGVHVLETVPMALPTQLSAWDPSMVHIDGRWYVGFVESPLQSPKEFVFHPALGRSGRGGRPTQLTRVAADPSRRQTEGTVLQKVGGRWYLLASDAAERKYRAYDLAMTPAGFLRAPYGTNIPHPQVVPIPEKGRTAYLLITFDGTSFHEEVLGYGTHGDVIVMRAAQTREGHEFRRVDSD